MPEFIRGLHNMTPEHSGNVVSIGSFDGVHLGHQAIIDTLKRKSQDYQVPSMVIIFEPQPHEFFSGAKAPARLMRLNEKLAALFEQGVDRVCCLSFNRSLRSLSAAEFIDQILVGAVGTEFLVIGDDFRFGCNREGDYALLKTAGFPVVDTPSVMVGGERVSSTRVRKLLGQGDFDQVHALLGRAYSVEGKVMAGRQLGRTLGVPTANINLHRYHVPLSGVFAVNVTIKGKAKGKTKGVTEKTGQSLSMTYQGVANVGVRPTVDNTQEPLLEVYLFDFDQTIYGNRLQVTFLHKLRQEQRFETLEALKLQIHNDITQAKEFFKHHDRL